MKTIIIPAHSSNSAIRLFKISRDLYQNELVSFWFLGIMPIPDNYNDLLTIGRQHSDTGIFDETFSKSISELIGSKNERIRIFTDHIYGDSPYVFRNYLQYREASLVVYDKEEWLNSRKETGLNVFRMVNRSGCEYMYVSGTNNALLSDNSHLRDQQLPTGARPLYTNAPASVQYQFKAVAQSLSGLEKNMQAQKVVSVKINHLKRYFLKEDALQKVMTQTACSMLLLHS